MPPMLLRSIAFLFGALWGSFFNLAIYRWPLGMSVVSPPSHCPGCGAPVPWYRNLPLIAYAMQGGKAACCGAKMTPRYLLVELASAVLCLALMERFVIPADDAELGLKLLEVLVLFFFVGGLLIATFIDLEHTIIPDEVSLPGTALGLATVSVHSLTAEDAAVGAGLGYLLIQLLFVWGYSLLFGRRGMGEGDSKLLMMIGAFCGWKGVLFALLGGSLQGIVLLIGAAVLRRDVTAGDEFADDPGPHNELAAAKAACLDADGEATKLVKEAIPLEPSPEEEAPYPGLTIKRALAIVLFCGGIAYLFLEHMSDPDLSALGAAISGSLGISLLVLYGLAGLRARRQSTLDAAEQSANESEDAHSGDAARGAPVLSLPRIPFGPFLALGALEWLFFGDQLTDWWFSLL